MWSIKNLPFSGKTGSNQMENTYYGQQYIIQAPPAAPKRKGRKMAMAAMIMGITAHALAVISFWLVYAFAYGRENMSVIRVSFLSIGLVIPAILAIILGIVAKARGSGKGRLIATIVNSVLSFLYIAINVWILIYYIGMTF